MTLALIDGDIIIYKAACAAEKETRWPDGVWTYTADEKDGLEVLEQTLESILEETKADSYIICLSDEHRNFRKHVYPKYKSNRSNNRKPLLLSYLRSHCLLKKTVCEYPHLEADDVMGILATSGDIEDDVIIATIDKDLLQIPVPVYNPDTQETSQPEERDCEQLFFSQVLTGDQVDGYPGCPGVGPKTVEKLFEDVEAPEEYWAIIVDQYKKKGLTEGDALVQARCAYILQADHYDVTGQITLWGTGYESRSRKAS